MVTAPCSSIVYRLPRVFELGVSLLVEEALVRVLMCLFTVSPEGHPDWFQLVGLIHDLGKIQFLWGRPEDGLEGGENGKQWSLGGDTWVLGCKLPDTVGCG